MFNLFYNIIDNIYYYSIFFKLLINLSDRYDSNITILLLKFDECKLRNLLTWILFGVIDSFNNM